MLDGSHKKNKARVQSMEKKWKRQGRGENSLGVSRKGSLMLKKKKKALLLINQGCFESQTLSLIFHCVFLRLHL